MEEATEYFFNGELLDWLKARYYDEEAEQIHNLDKDDANFNEKLCKALGIEIVDAERRERLAEIRKELKLRGADEKILSHAAQIALSQEDLTDLLEDDETTIYLCGKKFSIPIRFENRKYIGILGKPKIKIATKTLDDLTACDITFENVNLLQKLSPLEIIQGYVYIELYHIEKIYPQTGETLLLLQVSGLLDNIDAINHRC